MTKQSSPKAWMNLDGSSGTPTARATFNVTSFTDMGTGFWTANFTTAFSSVNFAGAGSGQSTSTTFGDRQLTILPKTTTTADLFAGQTATASLYDVPYALAIICGNMT